MPCGNSKLQFLNVSILSMDCNSLLVAFQGADSSSEAYVMVVIAKLLLGIQSRVGEALEEGVDVMCHGVVKRPKRKNRENLKIAGWTQACECGCSRCFTRLF